MLGLVGLVVVAALPPFSPPALLVDIEQGPSLVHRLQLAEATSEGVLYTQLDPQGGTSLWWSRWEGPVERVMPFPDGGIAFRSLGAGFILFAHAAQQVSVQRLDLSSGPTLEPLTTVSDVGAFQDTDSTSAIWWSGTQGTFTTDGTSAGTRLVTDVVSAGPKGVVLGERVWFADGGALLSWAGGTLTTEDPAGGRFVRAGGHLAIAGEGARNEDGAQLVDAGACEVLGGGDFAWLSCASVDGGQGLFVTDGTPGGTVKRLDYGGGRSAFASGDYALFTGDLNGTFAAFAVGRDSPPIRLPCAVMRVRGDALLCDDEVVAGSGAGSQQLTLFEASRAAGRRAVLQLPFETRFLLTDGTDAGSRWVPEQLPSWPTAGSAPQLLDSDGVHALFKTTQGVWMTDGTVTGTRRVGESAEFFGHSVLAFDGRLIALDEKGTSWTPPTGVIGVSGGLLVGRVGCEAFSVDESKVRKSLGCIDQLMPGKDGALLRAGTGETRLVRAGHEPFALPAEVDLASGVRCGRERCWFMTSVGTAFRANFVQLSSGAVTTVDTTLETGGVPPVLAADELIVVRRVEGFAAVQTDGRTTRIAEPFALTADGTLVWIEARQLFSLKARAVSSPPTSCPTPTELSVTGSRVHLLCEGPSEKELWSGTLDEGLNQIVTSEGGMVTSQVSLPTGGAIFGYSVSSGFANRLVVTDGTDQTVYRGLSGDSFAEVRGGLVFAGSLEFVSDPELWVLPLPNRPCGCDAGGSLGPLAVALLLLRKRRSGH